MRGPRLHYDAHEATAKFVNFIEQYHGVAALDSSNALDDSSRHRSNVSPSMAADFSLVVHSP